jgi:hypothetical protein
MSLYIAEDRNVSIRSLQQLLNFNTQWGGSVAVLVFYHRNHQINIGEVWYWEISPKVFKAGGCEGYCKAYFWEMLPKSHDLVDLANVSDEPFASVFGAVSTPQIVRKIYFCSYSYFP